MTSTLAPSSRWRRLRWWGPGATAGLGVVVLALVAPGAAGLALVFALVLLPILWHLRSRALDVKTLEAEVARLAQAAADQAGRLEHARDELDRRAREADSLLEIALATGSTLDEQELLRHIARGAARACRADRCSVYLLDESGTWLTPAMTQSAGGVVDEETWAAFTGPGKLKLPALPYLQEAVLKREPVVIPDATADFRVPRSWVELLRLRSLFAVPLLRLGRVVGALAFEYEDGGHAITPEQVQLAVMLAEQVALAMQNAGLYADAETRRREAEIMAEVVAAINGSLDLDTVLRRIAQGAKELCQSEIAALALRDPVSQSMLLRYHTGTRSGVAAEAAGVPPRRLLGTDRRGEARRIGEEYVAVMREEGLVAVLVVSIRSELGVEGLLYVGNDAPRPFTARHKAVLGQLAQHAAIAIKNGRLFEAAQTRLARMTRLAALSQLMVSSLDYRQVLHFVTTAALDLLGGDTARLWVVDEDAGLLRLASSEEREALRDRTSAVAELPVGRGLVGWVVAHRTKRYSADLLRDPLLSAQERATAGGQTSQIAVPLVVGERALGALVVMTKARRAFGPEDEELLELFASQAAAALENARLYQRTQQAYDELAQAQQQLTHAQKMEAVGRLAGGVAHDFNNLLTVIRGRAEQMLERLPPEHPLRRHADLIHRTGDRAAALTQQLLAFSRRQLMQPEVLDLNAVVGDMERMLRRVIGEDVAIEIVPERALGRVRADASQIEQVVMNLAVNARDAMPRGGTLTIRTANAEAAAREAGVPGGRYVALEVRDTGVGMDAQTRQRIFEPFFTTKEPGKGTGLGLATVYGIVAQSGGHIEVETAPGRGAAFRIYLPRVDAPDDAPVAAVAAADAAGGSETLLLLEDERDVREMAAEILTGQGYEVLGAARCVEALGLAERHEGPIQLLVTDVVMPEMSGPEVASRLVALRPDLKVLYVSGYADDALGQHGVLEPGVAFLPKPFTSRELARKVREVLDDTGIGRVCAGATPRS